MIVNGNIMEAGMASTWLLHSFTCEIYDEGAPLP